MTNADAAIARADKLRLDPQRPWPGPSTFTEDQRAYFFGRREPTEELFACVKRGRLTVLCGKSGLGKSSLLQAGLFPLLRSNGYLPIYLRLKFGDDEPLPDAQVKAKLEESILEHCLPEALPAPNESAWEYLHRRQKTLMDKEGNPVLPVVVFDQFEEWFIKGARTLVAEPFLASLTDLIENRVPEALEAQLAEDRDLARRLDLSSETAGYKVLVAMREDYVAHLQDLKETIPSLASRKSEMRLTEMNGRQALSVVLSPNPELVTSEVAERVVRLVAGTSSEAADSTYSNQAASLEQLEVAPWILSLVCWRLNDNRIKLGLGQITANLVQQQGSTIIEDFYNESLDHMHPAVRRLIEDRLLNKAGERNSIDLEEARADLEHKGASPASIDQLIETRLLSIDDRNPRRPRLELTHDVLAIPAKRSRDNWQAEQDLAEARRKAAAARRHTQVLVGVAAAMVLLAVFAGYEGLKAHNTLRVLEARERENQALRERNKEAEKTQLVIQARNEAMTALAEENRRALDKEKRAEEDLRRAKEKERDALDKETRAKNELMALVKRRDFDDCLRRPQNSTGQAQGSAAENTVQADACFGAARDAYLAAAGNVEATDELALIPLRLADSARRGSDEKSVVSNCNLALRLANMLANDKLSDPAKRRSEQIIKARSYFVCAYELQSVRAGGSTDDGRNGASILASVNLAGLKGREDWDRLGDAHLYQGLYLQQVAGQTRDSSGTREEIQARGPANAAAVSAFYQSFENAVQAYRASGNQDDLKAALQRGSFIGNYAATVGDDDTVKRVLTGSIQIVSELKDPKTQAATYGSLAEVQLERQDWAAVLRYRQEQVKILTGLNRNHAYPTAATDLAIAYGNLSWADVLSGQFTKGIDDAQKGLDSDPSQKWIFVNKAHALLFGGMVPEAKNLYQNLKDTPRTVGSGTLVTDLRNDFATLCELSKRYSYLNNPEIPAVVKELGLNVDMNTCGAMAVTGGKSAK